MSQDNRRETGKKWGAFLSSHGVGEAVVGGTYRGPWNGSCLISMASKDSCLMLIWASNDSCLGCNVRFCSSVT